MTFENGRITEDALDELKKHTDMIECQCPTYLISLIGKVREFETYTTECITKYPNDASTHEWLKASARNIDSMLSSTIVQLARMEGFIDDQNRFVDRKTNIQK